MTTDEIREKYFRFFEERGHKKIEPAPLVLKDDPTTLFTSAGMQPLIPYLKGKSHPQGKRLVDSQPSLRTVDIEGVGDNRHLTFFEMLGNWSLGGYFKKEQLAWIWQFYTEELKLPKNKLFVSVFEGTKEVPKDEESYSIWKELGIPESRIYFYGPKNNWWSRSGIPEAMPAGEIGGPDSEIFFDFGAPHNPKYGEKCHPNCECGRFLEIGNSVFIQYEKQRDGSLKELPQKNVDFGGGLERMAAAVNNNPDVFKIDIYKSVIDILEKETGIKYGSNEEETKSFRIIADHLRAATMIAKEEILPANKLQGYVLRRLIRKAVVQIKMIISENKGKGMITKISKNIVNLFSKDIDTVVIIAEEVNKFEVILEKGESLVRKNLSLKPFDLYQSYGLPYEISENIFSKLGKKLTLEDKKEFDKGLEKHQKSSRTASAGMFKGGLSNQSDKVIKFHTATHLIHTALRKILGEDVGQKGSNITPERLRFDFSYPQKLTNEEIRKVEDLVNEQIDKDLAVSFKEESLEDAIKEGALHFFAEKYGEKVKVYTIGSFSREICGGPHVTSTASIGRVRIIKQEKIGSGIVRVYAKLAE